MKFCLWIPVVCGLVVAGCSKNEQAAPTPAPELAASPAKPAAAAQPATPAPAPASPVLPVSGVSNAAVAPTTTAASMLAAATSVLKTVIPGVTNEVQQVLIPAIQGAVAELGQSGGFLNSSNAKIGMPSQLQGVEKMLRGLGQNQLPDQVVSGVNHAAEATVPVVGSVLTNAAAQLKPEDIKAAVTNAPGANSLTTLTDLLRQKAEPQLTQTLQPIVKSALDKTGTGSLCQQLMSKANSNPLAGLTGAASASTNAPAGIETFITTNTLNSFFKVVGSKEAQIRQSFAAKAGTK